MSRYSNPKANELEILHTYTVHNKGPSDAKRTEIKLMWPMLPIIGFNELTPLLYNIDLPNISRSDPKPNTDRCHIYHSVRFNTDHFFWMEGNSILFFFFSQPIESLRQPMNEILIERFSIDFVQILFFKNLLISIDCKIRQRQFIVMVHYAKLSFVISIHYESVKVFTFNWKQPFVTVIFNP